MAAKTAVIDASIAAKWFLLEPDRPLAREVQQAYALIAPELILPETMNAIWRNMRRSGLPAAEIPEIVDVLSRAFFQLLPLQPLTLRASEIAFDLDHPIYDAYYLALAERERCEFITADARLLRKTRKTPYAKFLRPLSP